jgi:hypothetical protein
VNHPIDFGGLLTKGFESGRRRQRSEFAGEAQGTMAEGLTQLPQELFAESLA